MLFIALLSLGQSLVGSILLSPGSWCAQGSVCALQESVSPVLCKFWWLYGVVNGNLLKEGLCHTQVSCTQSPCSSPPLMRTPQETLEHSYVSVSVGSLGPSAHKVCLSPVSISDGMGFEFKGQKRFCPSYHLAGASLPLEMGYLLTVAPVLCCKEQ